MPSPPPLPLHFTIQPLFVVLAQLRAALAQQEHVTFSAPHPDTPGLHAGEALAQGGAHRSLQGWLDVAECVGAQLLTPHLLGAGRAEYTLRRLPPIQRGGGYSVGSEFQRVNKLEDPWFLDTFTEALKRCRLSAGARLLSLGVGSGRELGALALAYPGLPFEVVGLDHDPEVLALAQARFPAWHFEVGDVNALRPDLGQFDCVMALSVLQSRGVNLDLALRSVLKHHLAAQGSVLVGLPNCRYSAGEVRYGARMLNYRDPDLSLLLSDAAHIRRHLNKHGFRVYVTGKYEVLITGVPARQLDTRAPAP